jgi:hypothetical protein
MDIMKEEFVCDDDDDDDDVVVVVVAVGWGNCLMLVLWGSNKG